MTLVLVTAEHRLTNEEVEAILDRVRERLAGQGWAVSQVPEADGGLNDRRVEFEHPVSRMSAGLSRAASVDEVEGFLMDVLGDVEFEIVAKLNPDGRHWHLLDWLRNAIMQFGWTRPLLQELLPPLVRAGQLTSDEAEWLVLAGPPSPFNQSWSRG